MNKYKLDAKAIDKAIDLALEQKRLVGAVVLVALGVYGLKTRWCAGCRRSGRVRRTASNP